MAPRMTDDNIIAAESFFNTDAELALLGAIFQENLAFDRVASLVGEKDFFVSGHARVFAAQAKLLDAGKPVDVITVAEHLESHGLLDEVGGMQTLTDIVQNTASAANVVRYAEIVREYAVLRRVWKLSGDISQKIVNRGGLSARELIDLAQSQWMQVGESFVKSGDGVQTIAEVMDSVIPALDDLYMRPDHEKSDVTGLATGLVDLDKLTTGFQPGDLVILAGRPSMGKTSLAMNIVEHAAMNDQRTALVFSLEMINDQLGVRMLASVSRLNQSRVKVARLNEAEMDKLNQASHRLRKARIFLDEESGLSVNDVRARARRIHRDMGGLDLIVIDYLQLMKFDASYKSESAAIGEITRGLKGLAKELQVPVVVLSQLNRSLEQRPNKRPIMSDLRSSGEIEQDADVILFVYRDEVYNEDSPDKGTAEIIIGKQRNGPIGTVRTAFVHHLMRFENFAADYSARDGVDI